MSALPVYQLPVEEQASPEVIYLIVPQVDTIQTQVIKPYSMIEKISLAVYNFQVGSRSKSDKIHALAFALSFTLIAGFWAYNVKSAFGINIFPHQKLENFLPLPGWQR